MILFFVMNSGSDVLRLHPRIALKPFVINTWNLPNATRAAWKSLEDGSSAMDAVVAGCTQCEKDQGGGTVGFGGSPDENGETILDAMIMDGSNHEVGSVAGLRRVKNAIGVAKAVLQYTKHTLLVGDLATQFAVEMGFHEESLSTPSSIERWEKWKVGNCQPNFRKNVSPDPSTSCGPYKPLVKQFVKQSWTSRKELKFDEKNHDTIGMISIDAKDNLAVGTSTNGATWKVPGRVGDSPIVGSGGYAVNDVGAATATGDGDIMMRFLPSYQAVESMRLGHSPEEAAKDAISRITRVHPSFSGAILVANTKGEHGAACVGFPKFPYNVHDSSGFHTFEVPCTDSSENKRQMHL